MSPRLRSALVAPVQPVLRALQARVDNAVRASDVRQEARLQEQVAILSGQQAAEAATQHRLRDERLAALGAAVGGRLDELDDQLRRISGQLVALEQRVGALERPAVDLAADEPDRREARALIDEVRSEHSRAQANLAAVAFYEERIARLEGRERKPSL